MGIIIKDNQLAIKTEPNIYIYIYIYIYFVLHKSVDNNLKGETDFITKK